MEFEKNPNIVATIDYWLDKVFPNERDENGKVIKWLTPWCYEIRMDWSHYIDKDTRQSDKIYDDAYTSSWAIQDGKFVSNEIAPSREKARIVECINSNKYNITQTLAETYEVFCYYEFKCAANGQFIGEYTDENGNVWRGRKVIFYNRAIKTDNPLTLDFQKNLDTVKRTCDSTEVYSKLYITPTESEFMTNGYITIADATANPTMEDYLLNFDYLYSIGSINEYQKDFISNYEKAMHTLNTKIKELNIDIENLTAEINDLKAEDAFFDKELLSAQEQYVEYEELRNNVVTNTPVQKNKTNSYSVVFVPEEETLRAKLKLEGITAGSIRGYKDYTYSEDGLLFTAEEFVKVKAINPIPNDDQNFYLVLDDYGYPETLYTSVGNKKLNSVNGSIVYLALEYSPKNKYTSICLKLQGIINLNKQQKRNLAEILIPKEEELKQKEQELDDTLKSKAEWYQKMEMVLGPALREGYWAPEENYEGAFQKEEVELKVAQDINSSTQYAQLFWDKELFEGEETGYYAILSENNALLGSALLKKLALGNEKELGSSSAIWKKYYNYLDISDLLNSSWKNADLSNLVIHFQNPSFTYEAVPTNRISAGKYYIIYNGKRHYFELTASPQKMEVQTFLTPSGEAYATIFIQDDDGKQVKLSTTTNSTGYETATNLTNVFQNIGLYLSDYSVYPNAGFVYSFIKLEDKVVPIVLFNNTDILYETYTKIAWYFKDTTMTGYFDSPLQIPDTSDEYYDISYPRIAILAADVNYDSDLLKIEVFKGENENGEEIWNTLKKFEDYQVLVRKGYPYITLKVTANNSMQDILYSKYRILYQISRANDLLYLDAKDVAKENSRPRFSYQVSLAQTPDHIMDLDLGQLVYINDYLVGIHGATGYVSEITLDLDNPKDDEVTIQNYKTKFEDLFATITAQTEAMKQSKLSYDLAASNFESGALSPETLQTAISDADLAFNFSNTNVSIDDVQGILLTNEKAYSNGVFGQVALQGGGIYLSDTMNLTTNERIWNTAITPAGINASLIRTGQLDTSVIRVYAGNEMAFQWNSEGIFAYKNENGIVTDETYVKYSQHGLEYVDGENTLLSLDWNGLIMRDKNGKETFKLEKETGNLTMSGQIYATGGVIGGLSINPDSLGSGTGVLIDKDSVKITANYDNQIFLDSNGIQLKTLIDKSSTLIQMDRNGILLEAAEELENGEKQVNQLALTKSVITFGIDKNVTISAEGLSGKQASFDNLTVGGKPVFGNYAEIVVSSAEKKPAGRNILWFKTTPIGRIESTFGSWSTGGSRHYRIGTSERIWCENGEHDGAERIKIGKMTPLDTDGEVNYTLSFPVYYWMNDHSQFTTEITAKLKLGEQEVVFTPGKVTVGDYAEVMFTTNTTAKNLITKDSVAANSELLLICKGTKSHNNFTINRQGSITLTVTNPNAHSGSDITEYNCEVVYIE